MAKYYVQCGPIRVVLTADGVENAALSGLEKSLHAHLWIYDDEGLSDQDCHDHLMLEAILHLDPEVRISERGFDRPDATCVGTPETVDRWHRLMIGMKRLFVAAGLAERTIASIAGAGRERMTRISRPR
jgi:hypothetical protein